jgi:acyl-CoA dehydrogenase
MDLTLSPDQEAIAGSIAKICAGFGDDYWSECDEAARFPEEFYRAIADVGFLLARFAGLAGNDSMDRL